MRAFALAALALVSLSAPITANEDWVFRRTTPRATLTETQSGLGLRIPEGRAWGIESDLHRISEVPVQISLDLRVNDSAVDEAFVRIAWYAQDTGRSKQLSTTDSELVGFGEGRRVVLEATPPPGAVAYRLRILGRIAAGELVSEPDAIMISRLSAPSDRLARPSFTRLRSVSACHTHQTSHDCD